MLRKILIISTFFALLSVSFVQAADFNATPSTGQFNLKQEFSVNIKIDASDESINAAQAKIKFSQDVLEVKSISKDGSIFNFWLQEPEFSNTDGTIEFIGGALNGVSGASLQVLKINFISKGAGIGEFLFSDAAITVADGSGTNVLSKANGARFTISSVTVVPAPIPAPISTPTQITRQPTVVSGLPALPVVKISLYPDSGSWYNFVSQFTPSWDLPPDISGLNTALNTNPNFIVSPVVEGLFENKTFSAIDKDGIYYFHIRFKNNNGWGPTAHYRIAIDTQPPIPFKIDVKTGLISDNPAPKLSFKTADSLSGISHDEIIVNSEAPVTINAYEYTLLPRQPGEYLIKVKVFDKAGNSIEDNVKIEILPIETPTITSISKKVVIGSEESLVIKGLAVPSANVVVTIGDKNKFLVLQDEAKSNIQGEWEFRLDRELRRGDYFVSVKAKDERGAQSLPTEPAKISFVEKPTISLFGLDVTLKELLIVLVAAVILAALWFYRKTLLHLTKAHRESVIISRDLKNSFSVIKKDLDKITEVTKRGASFETKELEINVAVKKIADTLDKIDEYLSKDIERLE
ncbi:MAG: hypothetical protein HYT61_02635 [Candidatus Yanofskybacteria bacterium]|nr:hypothetical protein [Candidatus Yanofskybacteria bacterium]